MEWIKSFWNKGHFSCSGTLVKLVDASDNYNKVTIFMDATLGYGGSRMVIKNENFDPDQEQLQQYDFPVEDNMFFTHYTYTDDDQVISGLKWRKLIGQHSEYWGFEFENPADFDLLSRNFPRSVEIEEEGHQHPSHSEKAKPSKLVALTNQQVPSNINNVVVRPDVLGSSEEAKIGEQVQFKRLALETLRNLYTPDQILFLTTANLYLIQADSQQSYQMETGIGFLLVKHPEFIYSFDLVRDSTIIMRNVMGPKFNYYISQEEHTVTWIEPIEETQRCWQVHTQEDLTGMAELCRVAMFEISHKQAIADTLNEEEQAWVAGQATSEVSEEDQDMEIEWGDDFDAQDSVPIFDSTQSLINPITVASTPKLMRLYQINGENLDYAGELPVPDGMTPYNLLFHNQDSELLMLNPTDQTLVHKMDMNRGQIVEEWTANGAAKLHTIGPVTKFAAMTPEQTMCALSDKSLFLLDPRLPSQHKIAQQMNYSKNPWMTCMATTAEGHVAVGTKLGEIKLFTSIGQRAKTSLPGFGDPIIGIDVTKDGEWVLATCSTYLIIIPVTAQGINGFKQRLGKKKRRAHQLCLKPQDVARYNLRELSFNPARFNLDEHSKETSIVTSIENLLIIWNFNQIKQRKYDKYIIKPCQDEVVKTEFRCNEDAALITYPRKIQYQRNRVRYRD